MRRCDRYLFSQLLLPSAIGLLTFAVIMLGDVARQMGAVLMGSRVPIWLLAQFLSCYIPHALSWAMPVGALVGVAMAMTLLTNHGEITALRAGGLGFPRLCRAFVLMGLLGAVASFVLGEYVAPPAVRRARELFAQIGLTQPVMQEQHNVFFRDGPSRRIFYIGHMNPASNQLERVTIWQQDEAGRVRGITTAEWAEARGEVWYLRQGASVSLDVDGQQTGPPVTFGEQEVTLWRALQDYYASQRTPVEMSAAELGDLVATVGGAARDTHGELVQLHFKYSLPLASLVFVLCGAPIAFRCARYGSFVGVIVAVGIVFLYNGVRSWTLAFGLAGTLDPFWAGWIPDMVFGALGLALLTATR